MHSTELTWDTGTMRFLGQLIVTALALWVTALILPGMHLGDDSAPLLTQVLTIGAIALILALVTTIVRPILSLLALPITCLTLGLFQLVINTLMLLLTSWISAQFGLTLQFDSFWWALLAGIVIGVLSAIVEAVTGLGDGERQHIGLDLDVQRQRRRRLRLGAILEDPGQPRLLRDKPRNAAALQKDFLRRAK